MKSPHRLLLTLLCAGAVCTAFGDEDQIKAGQTLVTSKCTLCHSLAKARSEAPESNLGHMRKKGKLADDELAAAVAYLNSLRSQAQK